MDNLGNTKITQAGLLILCRLELTYLNIGKVTSNIGNNNYGDEGAFVVAKHFHNLKDLWATNNGLGWEGVAAIANSTKLERLWIHNHEQIGEGVTPLGRLPVLKYLVAGTCEHMQGIPERKTGLQLPSPNS